jgi:hypothetical protein
MVSSGMISIEDLGVDPIKELLKGDPTDLVSSAPEIKALRDIFDRVSPNSDVTHVVDKVADGVASVQQAVAKPVEHAATAVVSVGNKVMQQGEAFVQQASVLNPAKHSSDSRDCSKLTCMIE